MLYPTARDWRAAPAKRVTLFGMSGLGKTHVSNILRASGDWFHYSIDYRIGTTGSAPATWANTSPTTSSARR